MRDEERIQKPEDVEAAKQRIPNSKITDAELKMTENSKVQHGRQPEL